ncbi:MAG: hypothetical protein GDA48_05730 [Hormoscilla sp. GM102CHS1]|nr:hypothetical protein [Hormoscilla sp. GM102CHS1]
MGSKTNQFTISELKDRVASTYIVGVMYSRFGDLFGDDSMSGILSWQYKEVVSSEYAKEFKTDIRSRFCDLRKRTTWENSYDYYCVAGGITSYRTIAGKDDPQVEFENYFLNPLLEADLEHLLPLGLDYMVQLLGLSETSGLCGEVVTYIEECDYKPYYDRLRKGKPVFEEGKVNCSTWQRVVNVTKYFVGEHIHEYRSWKERTEQDAKHQLQEGAG